MWVRDMKVDFCFICVWFKVQYSFSSTMKRITSIILLVICDFYVLYYSSVRPEVKTDYASIAQEAER